MQRICKKNVKVGGISKARESPTYNEDMGRRRDLHGLVVSALLVAFVLVLAVLQYRWTGQISEAERERMRASLNSSVRRFAEELDDEIARVLRSFRFPGGDRAAFVRAARAFHDESFYPSIVGAFFWVTGDADGSGLVWSRSDSDSSSTNSTEADALSVGEKEELAELEVAIADKLQWHSTLLPFVWADPAAIAFPVVEARTGRSTVPAAYIVARLDPEALKDILAEAVTRYFYDEGEPLYEVVVIDGARRTVYASPGTDAEAVVAHADATASLFSLRRIRRGPWFERPRPRPPRRRGFSQHQRDQHEREPSSRTASEGSNARGVAQAREAFVEASRELSRAHWSVFVRHRAGSLERAVTQARFRNLTLSFTVLGLLGASVVLVSVSARRASELGSRKLAFVAGVSHELRTPLAVIRSAAQNLADGSVSDAEQIRRYGSLIDVNGRRLNDLVDQVLALAGVRSSREVNGSPRVDPKTMVSAYAIVDGALADCVALVEESGATVSKVMSRELSVSADEESLRRALVNLITNAVKHGGPSIEVEVSVSKRPPRSVVFSVSDNGEGIAEEDRGRLFEAFYRGNRARDRQTPGSGLGLSLVEEIVREHGGSVEVDSTPGEGSTFRIILPGADSEDAP